MEYSSASDADHNSIVFLISTKSVITGTACESTRFLRIKFHGAFDMPLGRYLRDGLFDQTQFCQFCKEPTEAHITSYTHLQGNLEINVRRVPSLKLEGEEDGKIWRWNWCSICERKGEEEGGGGGGGVPPASRRAVMSDADLGVSFGKFLMLGFSNYATGNHLASCGHLLSRGIASSITGGIQTFKWRGGGGKNGFDDYGEHFL